MASNEPEESAKTAENGTKDVNSRKQNEELGRFNAEMKALNEEMDIAVYATNKFGRAKRKVPRKVAQDRSIKRKLLEKEDSAEQVVLVEENLQKMRGSRIALELGDNALGSLIADDENIAEDDFDEGAELGGYLIGEDDEEEEEASENSESEAEEESKQPTKSLANDNEDASYYSEKKRVAIQNNEQFPPNAQSQTTEEIERYKKILDSSGRRVTRKVYRLRNFTSHRLAQRHGEALGAHAQGKQRKAVEKLGEVAERAPTAPQVYSSLGLVYESLLEDAYKERETTNKDEIEEFTSRLELGKKKYGSLHVAAVLCKKDYTLWVRAADAACDIADMHTEAMSRFPTKLLSNRQEKKKWLNEAKNDYIAADNLNPPGISVPAKLAYVQMQLGNLSESLTILTDLRNNSSRVTLPNKISWRKSKSNARSELERSYTAWLLYSDLMLQVGYECHQWNLKRSINENYMFKRWLRKFSLTFDWKERRLQALCLALEAACGSETTSHVVLWMKDRNNRTKMKKNEMKESVGEGSRWLLDNYAMDADEGTEKSTETTEENDAKNEQRKAAINSEILEESSKLEYTNSETKELDQNDKERKQNSRPHILPMSASLESAFEIASHLMKHCLGMELFDCTVLVAESISLYLKARMDRRTKRLLKRQSIDEDRRTQEMVTIQSKIHDRITVDTDESDDEIELIIPDDNDIDEICDKKLIESLTNGCLPPELETLYALSLVGKGGKDFLAWNLLKSSIMQLEVETADSIGQDLSDTGIIPDNAWTLFRRAATSSIRRNQAILLLVDIVGKLKKTDKWANKLGRMIRAHVKFLEKNNSFMALRPVEAQESNAVALIRNQHVRLVIGLAQMYLYNAKDIHFKSKQIEERNVKNGKRDFKTLSAGKLALAVVELMVRFRHVLWHHRNRDGSIHTNSLEMLRLLAGAFPIIMASKGVRKKDAIKYESLADLQAKLRHFLALICNVKKLDSTNKGNEMLDLGDSFPISHEWQEEEHKSISLRVYNLCVACNVSAFSGWERDEFSMSHLQRRNGSKFFGIKIGGEYVSGYLDENVEIELSNQWKLVDSSISNAPLLDFESSLYMAKRANWYKFAMEKLRDSKNKEISLNGEKESIYLLLLYSRLSLLVASYENVKGDEHLKIPLSIILPMLQYCLDQRIWDSQTGTGAATMNRPEEWEQFIKQMSTHDNDTINPDSVSLSTRSNRIQKNLRTNRSAKKSTSILVKPKQVNNFTPKTITIPTSELLKKWHESGTYELDISTAESRNSSSEKMRNLDARMKQLRSCFTVQALQRTSMHVAVALLDVATGVDCYNPFLCLHQAAMFAGQGSKGGSSDAPFKSLLPPKNTCTELEALITLGRADCMRALAFLDQAMFLCSYVAEVCCMHRDEKKYEFVWNNRWVVVGIQMYTVSMAIDKTIEMIPDMDARKSSLLDWDDHVKDEIERGKSDASSVYKSCDVKVRSCNINFVSSERIAENGHSENLKAQNEDNIDLEYVGVTFRDENNHSTFKSPENFDSINVSPKVLFDEGDENFNDEEDDDDAVSISVVAV